MISFSRADEVLHDLPLEPRRRQASASLINDFSSLIISITLFLIRHSVPVRYQQSVSLDVLYFLYFLHRTTYRI